MLDYKNISDWVVDEDSAYRYILGTDKNNPNNRLAMIGKSPRIQVVDRFCWQETKDMEHGITVSDDSIHSFWIYGFKGPDCYDEDSRRWCDQMLKTIYGFDW